MGRRRACYARSIAPVQQIQAAFASPGFVTYAPDGGSCARCGIGPRGRRRPTPPGGTETRGPRMSIGSSGNLIDALKQTALLGEDQLAQLPRLAEGRCADPRPLAKVLVQRG